MPGGLGGGGGVKDRRGERREGEGVVEVKKETCGGIREGQAYVFGNVKQKERESQQ